MNPFQVFMPFERSVLSTGIHLAFNPRRLYAQGEQGAWYDPSDLSTLFQDSAGTIPVTASGQPVGLMLDKSRGLVRGPELVADPELTNNNSPAEWSLAGTGGANSITFSGGQVTFVTDGANISINKSASLVVGRVYEVAVSVTAASGATPGVYTGSADIAFLTGTGTRKIVFTATGTILTLKRIAGSSGSFTLDSISVRELPGAHGVQATAASRPIYRRGDSRGVVNLLLVSNTFQAWAFNSNTVPTSVNNAGSDPEGTNTAWGIPVGATGFNQRNYTIPATADTYTWSTYVRATAAGAAVTFLSNGLVGVSLTNATFDFDTLSFTGASNGSVVDIGNGWYRLQQVFVNNGSSSTFIFRVQSGGNTNGKVLFWGAQLNLGSSALPYQRNDATLGGVATGLESDLRWRELDGSDDHMTGATGGGGTAGFFFCRAVTPTGGNATIRTLWSDAGTNTGYRLRLNASNQVEFSAGNGTAFTTVTTAATLALNTTGLITAWDDGVNLNVQLNDGTVASVARPAVAAGTAGFTLGKANGASSNHFAGHCYPGVYLRDTGLTDAQRNQVKLYCKNKAGL
jgi:hypothetical protein